MEGVAMIWQRRRAPASFARRISEHKSGAVPTRARLRLGDYRHMKKGFTLVEILVVTTIVALVAAILFPAFANAKKAAYRAETISNLRQCGMAIIIYTEDYSADARS